MTEAIKQQKQSLRQEMLRKRNGLSAQERKVHSERISQNLIDLINERAAKSVHAYLPMPGEIDITPVLHYLLDKKISVATPQALPGRQMRNLILNSLKELEEGVFGTRHPANSTTYDGHYDLIIIPGLAFDAQNFRLGFGAGYYDAFLKDQPKALKVGLAFPFQLVEKVPRENHDVALDRILM